MKKTVSLLLLPLLSSSLSGCFIDDGKWKEEYGDPVMFMETVIKKNNPQHYGSCYFLYEHETSNLDQDFVIAKAIKASGPFTEPARRMISLTVSSPIKPIGSPPQADQTIARSHYLKMAVS